MLSSIKYLTSYELRPVSYELRVAGCKLLFYELLYTSGELLLAHFIQGYLQNLECARLSDLLKITLENSEAVISLLSYEMPKGRGQLPYIGLQDVPFL